jgi:hypothetical protein
MLRVQACKNLLRIFVQGEYFLRVGFGQKVVNGVKDIAAVFFEAVKENGFIR